MKTCTNCREDLKYIAGGISKKGNRYEAFWGCKSKECDYSEEPTPEEIKKYDLEARINKMEEEQIRFKEMAWMNAINSATEIVKDMTDEFGGEQDGAFRRWRDMVYAESMEWFVKSVINEED